MIFSWDYDMIFFILLYCFYINLHNFFSFVHFFDFMFLYVSFYFQVQQQAERTETGKRNLNLLTLLIFTRKKNVLLLNSVEFIAC